MSRWESRQRRDPPQRAAEAQWRTTVAVIGGLFLFLATLYWGWLALAAASHGSDLQPEERCGAFLPYTFLNITAGMGFLSCFALVWLTFGLALGGKTARWWLAVFLTSAALFGAWTLAGGFTAASCAFD